MLTLYRQAGQGFLPEKLTARAILLAISQSRILPYQEIVQTELEYSLDIAHLDLHPLSTISRFSTRQPLMQIKLLESSSD